MENEYAIEVQDVKKKFKVYYDKGNMLKDKLLFWNRNKYEEKWVLNGISFKIKKGEAVGLIGHNGCGKSTTLKLLTKIIYPDSGKIIMRGRVSSLLELGAGFHPDMSGRENIYINASVFGLTHSEIEKKIDDIIEFSELGKYIDNPVRTYSSGMYMRLAFSVAINVNADILLIDEILAVGDINFQEKCFNKLMDIKKEGVTIVLVSHSMAQIESICDRSIWIQDGLKMEEGKSEIVDAKYLNYMRALREKQAKNNLQDEQTVEYVQELRDLKSGKYKDIFDANFYYNMNPDVARQIGQDAPALLAHFVNDGMKEGRQGNPEFIVKRYKANYTDLQQLYGNNLKKYYLHYMERGKNEGRISDRYMIESGDYSAVFKAEYYASKYPDVAEKCGGDERKLLEHFLRTGMKEGKQGSDEFNVWIYQGNYKDLYDDFKGDLELYYMHYILLGKEEGRSGNAPVVRTQDETELNPEK